MLSSPLTESLMHQYETGSVPFALTDEQLRIVWYNDAARQQCPSLVMGEGMESVKLIVGEETLETMLRAGQVYHTPCLQEPLFRYAVTIIPVMEGDQLSGAMITAGEAKPAASGSDNLSAVFSRQIREPLFAVFSSLQQLNRTLEEAEIDAGDSIQQINRQCYHLLRFAMNFSEMIRLENGAAANSRNCAEICSLLERLCSALYLTALDREIRFSFTLPEGPLYLLCDTHRLIYAVLLLAANAFRFAPGGEVSLKASYNEGKLQVILSDNGCGIPGEYLPKIYDAGFSMDPVTKMPVGAGIGLTVLRQMILSAGGTLLITSEGTDCGTQAIFDLPCDAEGAIPLFRMDPMQEHLADRFSLFHILMSGVSEPPELD